MPSSESNNDESSVSSTTTNSFSATASNFFDPYHSPTFADMTTSADDRKESENVNTSSAHDDHDHRPLYLSHRPPPSTFSRNFAIHPVDSNFEVSPTFSPVPSPLLPSSSSPNLDQFPNIKDLSTFYNSNSEPYSPEFGSVSQTPLSPNTLTSRILHIAEPPTDSTTQIFPANYSSHYVPDSKKLRNHLRYANRSQFLTSLSSQKPFDNHSVFSRIFRIPLKLRNRLRTSLYYKKFVTYLRSHSLSVKQFSMLCVAFLYVFLVFSLRSHFLSPTISIPSPAFTVDTIVDPTAKDWTILKVKDHGSWEAENYGSSLEGRDETIDRLLAERSCVATDIVCYIAQLSPSSFLSWNANSQKTILLLVVQKNGINAALNTICSASNVGIPESQWLIIAGDLSTFYSFLLRNIHVILANSTSSSHSFSTSKEIALQSQAQLSRTRYFVMNELLRKDLNVFAVNSQFIFLNSIATIDFTSADLVGTSALVTFHPTNDSLCSSGDAIQANCSTIPSIFYDYYYIKPSKHAKAFVQQVYFHLLENPSFQEKDSFNSVIVDWQRKNMLAFIEGETDKKTEWIPWKSSRPKLYFSFFSASSATDIAIFLRQNMVDIEQNIADESKDKKFPLFLYSQRSTVSTTRSEYLRKARLWFVTPQLTCRQLSNSNQTTFRNGTDILIPHRARPRFRNSVSIPLATPDVSFSSGNPSLLFFSSPKPLSMFRELPKARESDEDGLGQSPGASEMTNDEITKYLSQGETQLEAQLLVLRSWFGLGKDGQVETMLFSKDVGHRILSDELSFDILDRFETDNYGAPKLHSVFRTAEHIATHRSIPYCMYANGDLMFGQNLLDTMEALKSYNFAEVLAVGVRHALPFDLFEKIRNNNDFMFKEEMGQLKYSVAQLENGQIEPAKFGRNSTESLFESLVAASHVFPSTEAIDYFLYSRGLWNWHEVPRFLLGRIAFDNWLLNWANRRESTTVIDVSETVTALHIDHSHNSFASHSAPNSLTNLKLGGQSSRRGIGRLEYTSFKTTRRADGRIIVVRKKPDSGLTKVLFDMAEKASFVLDSRPTLIVVTVNNAFVPVFRNWIAAMMMARGTTKGILVLSAGSNATACATQFGLPVFSFATDDSQFSLLNDYPNSYLQILAFRAKAILLLLEFGFDVLNSHVDEIWLSDPFTFLSEELGYSEEDEAAEEDGVDGQRSSTEETPTQPAGLATSINPKGIEYSSISDEYDMIGMRYTGAADLHNISMGGLYIRHSPESIRVWRRLRTQFSALMARSTMNDGLILTSIQEDWYIHFELKENPDLRWISLSIDETRPSILKAKKPTKSKVPVQRFLSFAEYDAGVLFGGHHLPVIERQIKGGYWLVDKP